VRGVGRLFTNLGTIVVLTLALLAYATVQWVGGAFLEDRYELTVPLPRTGGLFVNQEVTVLGHGVGVIKDQRLTDDGVEIVLDIRGDDVVPETAVVQVLRRSAIGEQALNFIPVGPDYRPPEGELVASDIPPAHDWEAAERGATIQPVATSFPTEVPEVLRRAITLFEAVDPGDLDTVVHELAVAFAGREDLLKELSRDTLDLNRTLVSGIPEFQRLIDSSGPLLEELNEHREALAAAFPPLADVSDLLAAKRPTLEEIIDAGTPLLRQGDALIANTRANQHCIFADFAALNRLIAEPENLHDLSRGLRMHRAFYQRGFDVFTQFDPFRPGLAWQRIHLLIFQEAGGQPNVPHRPTPATRPGAACRSPFGVGVDAVRQADHQPADPTAPPIDFAPLVEGGQAPNSVGGSPVDLAGRADDRRGQRGGATAGGPLPATGGGVAGLVAPLALAAAWVLGRRR
jgi:virulence factor Mce-like protein